MTNKTNKRSGVAKNLPILLSSFHLEADRSSLGFRITVSGIIGINDFTNECVLLSSHAGRIRIFGKNLNLEIYENKIVEISGLIEEIGFGKNKD